MTSIASPPQQSGSRAPLDAPPRLGKRREGRGEEEGGRSAGKKGVKKGKRSARKEKRGGGNEGRGDQAAAAVGRGPQAALSAPKCVTASGRALRRSGRAPRGAKIENSGFFDQKSRRPSKKKSGAKSISSCLCFLIFFLAFGILAKFHIKCTKIRIQMRKNAGVESEPSFEEMPS